jgi:hypothetical protein
MMPACVVISAVYSIPPSVGWSMVNIGDGCLHMKPYCDGMKVHVHINHPCSVLSIIHIHTHTDQAFGSIEERAPPEAKTTISVSEDGDILPYHFPVT